MRTILGPDKNLFFVHHWGKLGVIHRLASSYCLFLLYSEQLKNFFATPYVADPVAALVSASQTGCYSWNSCCFSRLNEGVGDTAHITHGKARILH